MAAIAELEERGGVNILVSKNPEIQKFASTALNGRTSDVRAESIYIAAILFVIVASFGIGTTFQREPIWIPVTERNGRSAATGSWISSAQEPFEGGFILCRDTDGDGKPEERLTFEGFQLVEYEAVATGEITKLDPPEQENRHRDLIQKVAYKIDSICKQRFGPRRYGEPIGQQVYSMTPDATEPNLWIRWSGPGFSFSFHVIRDFDADGVVDEEIFFRGLRLFCARRDTDKDGNYDIMIEPDGTRTAIFDGSPEVKVRVRTP